MFRSNCSRVVAAVGVGVFALVSWGLTSAVLEVRRAAARTSVH